MSLWLFSAVVRGDAFDVLPEMLEDGPKIEMMHRWLMRQAEAALDRRTAEYEKVKTRDDLAGYQQRMRRFFGKQLGGFPERTPLRATTTGKLKRDGYTVEKIIYESLPKHFVTALLYLPEGSAPFPGVIVPCGHSANGKAAEFYQRACILLAKHGIAAFCYDPTGQGERLQILTDDGRPLGSTLEHTLIGISCIPLGTNTARYHMWDGIRALDYLTGRLEIDAGRLGCAGNSGGGTLTSYLMAWDERIACAAPSCYITSMRALLERQGPQDAEQNIHGQLAEGLTHAEYILMRAPKPTLICTATRDMFPIAGSWDTFREAKRFYGRMGYWDRVNLVETDQPHGYTVQLREATVRWMRRWLMHIDEPVFEEEFPVLTDAEAQCSPDGQVMKILGAKSVFDFNAEWDARLAKQREKLRKKLSRDELLKRIRELTGLRPLDELPKCEVRETSVTERNGYELRKLLLMHEAGITLPAVALVPKERKGPVVLYVDGQGKHDALADEGELDRLARSGTMCVAIDLRGTGELYNPNLKSLGGNLPKEWRDWFLAYMLDKSYVGLWAEDVLVTGRWLRGYEAGAKPNLLRVVGVGQAGPAVLHAAAVESDLFARVDLRGSLTSWSDVVRTRGAPQQLLNLVHGALAVYDLPDLVELLGPVKLNVIEPRGALGEAIKAE
ncbi:MAG TPA: hypothetical protein VHZ24_14510 [Pirellulales bacterium]|nr:hypothetical protein [Pirellulales bacterium]